MSSKGQGHSLTLVQILFSSITTDSNISSALRWAIQDQWSSGLFMTQQNLQDDKIMCAQWSLRSACSCALSDERLHCPHEEAFGSWLRTEHPVKSNHPTDQSLLSTWRSYPLSTQRRLCSDWADAQADLSLCLAHRPYCWFCRVAAHIILEVPFVCHHVSVYLPDTVLNHCLQLFDCLLLEILSWLGLMWHLSCCRGNSHR